MSNVKARLKTLQTDSDIIQLVVNGNTNAFRLLVERYEVRVASVCMNMLKDPNLAEEVGQETFVRLFKSLNSFKGNSTLGTYITRIAINLCLNKLKQVNKSEKRYTEIPKEGIQGHHTTVDQTDSETKEIINIGLQALKPADRSVVVLRMIEGYSIKETSQLLGISEGTVMSKLSRALKKMHDVLKNSKIYDGKS